MNNSLKDNLHRLLASLIAASLLCLSGLAQAQDDEDKEKQRKPPTQQTEKLSRAVFEQIDKAQKELEAKNLGKAEAIMDELKAKSENLNDYEKAQMYNFYAAIHYEQEKTEQTIQDYKNILALEKVPESLRNNSLFRLAQLYFVGEDYAQSIKVLDAWIARVDSVRPEAYMLKAQAYYQTGDYENAKAPALNAMREARSRGQQPKESWLGLLRAVYYEIGDYKTASKLLTVLIEQYPSPDYYKQLAGMLGLLDLQNRQAQVMHAAYTAGMLESESEILNMARLYMAQDAPYPAVEVIKDAMRRGKVEQSGENLQLLAQAMALAKDYEGQIPVLKKAAQLSGDAKQYQFLGQAQIALYEWQDAAESLQKAVNIGGLDDVGQLYMQIGTAYYNQKKYNQARQAFKNAQGYSDTEQQASQWVKFVNQEVERDKAIRQGL